MEPDAGRPSGFSLQAQTTGGLIGKIILLAVVTAIAVWLAIPLIATEQWVLLAIVVVTTIALYAIYLQPVHIPIKYLVPGTIFLIIFQVIPVIFTGATAFTNFGDGHRGTKEDAIAAVERGSVQQVEGSTEYVLTIAAEGDAATGDLVFLLVDPETMTAQQGDAEGLTPLPDAVLNERGKVTEAPEGLVLLSADEVGARSEELETFFVPTENGRDQEPGVESRLRGQSDAGPTTRPATASPIRRPARSGRPTTMWARSSPRTARPCHRAGRSTSACRTSPAPSPTRPCPARS